MTECTLQSAAAAAIEGAWLPQVHKQKYKRSPSHQLRIVRVHKEGGSCMYPARLDPALHPSAKRRLTLAFGVPRATNVNGVQKTESHVSLNSRTTPSGGFVYGGHLRSCKHRRTARAAVYHDSARVRRALLRAAQPHYPRVYSDDGILGPFR